MNRRLELQDYLESLLGSKNVYFQSPNKVLRDYPCIIYKLNRVGTKHANNRPYFKRDSYTVTLIHKDPDNDLKDILAMEPYCSFDRSFTSDNLHHYVYELYF